MPRDSQGLYALPAGNPVVPGTLIEATWANGTMSDVGDALTGSLPRDGSAPMTGQLTLPAALATSSRHAASKAYVDQFAAYASGMAVGAIFMWPSASIVPGSCVKCDGQAISRATYPDLFTLIGTSFGSGDGSTTFNVPNLVDQFVRGRGTSRTMGSLQADSVKTHQHPVTDSGHTHGVTDTGHSHPVTTVAHGHTVSDPGHSHGLPDQTQAYADGTNTTRNFRIAGASTSSAAATGISLGTSAPTGTAGSTVTGNTIQSAITNLSVGAFGDTETRPTNVALDFYIKALQDAGGPTLVTSLDTSDANMIAIDATNPAVPVLQIQANVAYGTVKLDQQGRIPTFLLPAGNQTLLGTFDASGGNNPTEEYPAATFINGDTFIVGVNGTINVYSPATLTSSATLVTVGNQLLYIEGSLTNPTGWYYIVATVISITASQVAFTPVGGIAASNVQAALAEVDSEKAVKPVGSAILKGDGAGGFASAVASTDYAPATTGSAILKGNATGGFADATAGTDYLAPAAIGTTVQAYDANTVKSNASQTFTLSQRATQTTDNDLSFNLAATNNFDCTLAAGGTLTFTGIASAAGQSGSILLVNGANYAVAKAATTMVDISFLTTVSTTGTYRISYYCDGTNVYCTTTGALS